MAAPSVEDRLADRRARLQPLCMMEPVKQHLRLSAYHNLARQLFKQMEAYVADEAWDQAYVYLARFVKLCSKVIPAHADYNNPKYERERKWISSQAEQGLKLFDVILKGMEESELELMEDEREQERRRSVPTAPTERARVPPSTAFSWAPPPPPPLSANLTLEDRFAALRLRKAQDARLNAASEKRAEPSNLRSTYTGPTTDRSALARSEPSARLARSTVSYPTVNKAHWMQDNLLGSAAASVRRPRRPVSRQASREALDQLSSGKLRTLEIPSYLISEFTAIAAPNTRKYPDGIETCGILAGKLHESKLVITTLIIPKQEGSSDMCTMKNEEELFDYCFSHDLLTLGWIHTHPRQNCFLSSVDIHTQCGFQSMLPEAIAIVVAPTDTRRNVGVFRLTEPSGMQLIQQCTLQGFHVHPEHIHIYSDAIACEWNAHSKSNIVDMR